MAASFDSVAGRARATKIAAALKPLKAAWRVIYSTVRDLAAETWSWLDQIIRRIPRLRVCDDREGGSNMLAASLFH